MDKQKIILWIWVCLVVVFTTYFVCQIILNTIIVYKTSQGTELSIDAGGLAIFALVIAVYYATKILLKE